jgi:hypothetical protein
MPCIDLVPKLIGRVALASGFLALTGALAFAQSTAAPDAPAGGATSDQGAAVVPSAPPGISITPPTQPMFRPRPPRNDDDAPVEGCPAGPPRKLELLV